MANQRTRASAIFRSIRLYNVVQTTTSKNQQVFTSVYLPNVLLLQTDAQHTADFAFPVPPSIRSDAATRTVGNSQLHLVARTPDQGINRCPQRAQTKYLAIFFSSRRYTRRQRTTDSIHGQQRTYGLGFRFATCWTLQP